MHRLRALALALVSTASLALPQHDPVPGGVAVIDLGVAGATPPLFRSTRLTVILLRPHFLAISVTFGLLPAGIRLSLPSVAPPQSM